MLIIHIVPGWLSIIAVLHPMTKQMTKVCIRFFSSLYSFITLEVIIGIILIVHSKHFVIVAVFCCVRYVWCISDFAVPNVTKMSLTSVKLHGSEHQALLPRAGKNRIYVSVDNFHELQLIVVENLSYFSAEFMNFTSLHLSDAV